MRRGNDFLIFNIALKRNTNSQIRNLKKSKRSISSQVVHVITMRWFLIDATHENHQHMQEPFPCFHLAALSVEAA
jgi:hypothetical protein